MRDRRPAGAGLIAFCALVYVIVLGSRSLARHDAVRTQMNDLGNADQAIWFASRGDLSMPQSNDADRAVVSRLAVHLNFIYYAIAPLYRLWSDPRLLLMIATIACALAGVGLYVYSRSVLPAIAWWISPIVHDANLYDFKIITVVAAALVWATWAFESGRERLGWTLCGVILLSQEDFALLPLFLGVYYMLSGNRRRGAILITVAAIYLAIMFLLFVPWISDGAGLANLSGSDSRIAMMRSPADVARVFRPDRLRLPLYLLLSGAIVAFSSWRFLLLLIPGVLACMLNDSSWMTRITGTYYHVVSLAIIAIAVIKSPRPSWRFHYLLGASALFALLFSPLRDAYAPVRLNEVRALIPAGAAMSAQNNVGAHFAHRSMIGAFPRRLDRAEYVLHHLRYGGGGFRTLFQADPQQVVVTVERQLFSSNWKLLYQRDGFYLFRRSATAASPSRETLATFHADVERLSADVRRYEPPGSVWRKLLNGSYDWPRAPN